MFKPLVLIALLGPAAGDAQELDDPTRPTRPVPAATRIEEPRKSAPAPWRLQSTLIARARKLAVINGRLVGEGDRVNGARVVRVRPGRVELEKGGRTFELRLTEAAVKSRRIEE